MYEVLRYESTLELKDRGGRRATLKKREKVRYLQDSVIAYQDQAWGDGEILVNYRCSPGTPVDRYRAGYKTYALISRREVKNKGDRDEFNIEWGIRQGFLKRTGHWETHVTHRTRHLKLTRAGTLWQTVSPFWLRPASASQVINVPGHSANPGAVAGSTSIHGTFVNFVKMHYNVNTKEDPRLSRRFLSPIGCFWT
jgi:hypothetical protein